MFARSLNLTGDIMLSQWVKLQELAQGVFRHRDGTPSPADEMAVLTGLVMSGDFEVLEEDSRRNKVCRIGVLGGDNFALAGQAVWALGRLLTDPDNIVRWDAAFGIIEITKKHSLMMGDALLLLEGVRAGDPDPELRTMVEMELRRLRAQRNAQADVPGVYPG